MTMKRQRYRPTVLLLILAASLIGRSAALAQTSQHLIFRVKVGDLLLQNSSLASGKAPAEFVELTLPGKLYAPPIQIAPIPKSIAKWDTPIAAATADFSADKADDDKWIAENFAPGDRAEVRQMLDDKEIRQRNSSIFRNQNVRYIAGEAKYKNYTLLFVRDGSISAAPKVMTLEKAAEGYRRTNALSKDSTFDVVWSSLRSGEVKAAQ